MEYAGLAVWENLISVVGYGRSEQVFAFIDSAFGSEEAGQHRHETYCGIGYKLLGVGEGVFEKKVHVSDKYNGVHREKFDGFTEGFEAKLICGSP